VNRFAPRALAAVLLAACVLPAAPARASVADFVSATCGTPCADPVGEEQRARDNWSALTAMGTTQWVGSTMGSTTVDASGLLAASRYAGASELDRWLTTGVTADPAVAQQMSLALQQFSGIDVSGITGISKDASATDPYANQAYASTSTSTGSSSNLATNLVNALQTSLNSGTAFMGPGGGGGSGYCNKGVDDALGANAQKYVNNMQSLATSSEFGFSQLGGSAISSGQRSASGYYGSSCLDSMLSGTRDMLFKPPALSSLLSQLSSMFGGGSGGCGNAQTIMAQLKNSMPNGVFASGLGGFFPHASMTSFEGDSGSATTGFANGFGLASSVGQSSIMRQPASLTSLFSR